MREYIKQRIRHFTAVLLILIFTLTGTLPAFAAAVKLIPVDVSLVRNTITYDTTEVEVLWSDEWFDEPSTEYNHELAITSIALSDMAYLEGGYAVHSDSDMRRALTELGFDEGSIVLYNYDYPYTKEDNDVVAFTLAAKQIDDFTLIAVIIRGTMEELEWDSDLRISANAADYDSAKEHYGFYQAEKKLVADLSNYISVLLESNEAINGDTLRFYVTGHSRGGSVADILAAELDDSYGKDRVYAYTFAAPAVAAAAGESGYENIFNILSADDDVSQLPFSKLDFRRFGLEKVIASSGEYESQNDDDFMAHNPYVYYVRLKSGLADTLYE